MNKKGSKCLKMTVLAFVALAFLLLSIGSTVSAGEVDQDNKTTPPVRLPPNPEHLPGNDENSEYSIPDWEIHYINPPNEEDKTINDQPGPPQEVPEPPENTPEPITPPGNEFPQPQPPILHPEPPKMQPGAANLA